MACCVGGPLPHGSDGGLLLIPPITPQIPPRD